MYLLEDRVPLGVYTVNGAGTVVSSYFNLLGDTRVVGRQPSVGSRSYYHTDLLGSTRAVVQGATVTESYDYDPWGVLLPGRTLGSGTKEQFTTKERDGESALDYFGARSYASALGRWTTVDPAVAADAMPEWGPYGYVNGNPATRVDAHGLCTPKPSCDAALSAFEATGAAIGLFLGGGSGLIETIVSGGALAPVAIAQAAQASVLGAATGRVVGEAIFFAKELLGRNPDDGGGRTNTDLPGGRATGKSIFRDQTKGQPIKQTSLGNGGIRRTAPDGTQIRMNPDGTTRVDLPNRGPQGNETIHIKP